MEPHGIFNWFTSVNQERLIYAILRSVTYYRNFNYNFEYIHFS